MDTRQETNSNLYKTGVGILIFCEKIDRRIGSHLQLSIGGKLGVKSCRAVAQTSRLPFDRLRANGDMLKSCDFSAHAELVEA